MSLPAHPTTEKADAIMLSQAIGNLLPSAIGVALSPVPIIAVILMLGTPKARSTGTAFALGWVTGLVAVSVIVLIVAGGASNPNSDTATGVNWLDVFLGVLFLAMAARQWRGRPKKGEEATMPRWMASIDGFGSGKSAGLGVLLSGVNPKNPGSDAGGRGRHRSGRTERRTERGRRGRVRGDRIALRGGSGSLLSARAREGRGTLGHHQGVHVRSQRRHHDGDPRVGPQTSRCRDRRSGPIALPGRPRRHRPTPVRTSTKV